jgi:hypothetical protein
MPGETALVPWYNRDLWSSSTNQPSQSCGQGTHHPSFTRMAGGSLFHFFMVFPDRNCSYVFANWLSQ